MDWEVGMGRAGGKECGERREGKLWMRCKTNNQTNKNPKYYSNTTAQKI